MALHALNRNTEDIADAKAAKEWSRMEKLRGALEGRTLSDETENLINAELGIVNQVDTEDRGAPRLIAGSYQNVIGILEKRENLVAPNHYQSRWMAMGMAIFGVPLGVAFGAALENTAFIGIGLPIGLSFGLAIGSGMDRKAAQEGRQLDI
jgi:hypothetical protein